MYKRNSFELLSQEVLEKELNSVLKYLDEFQNDYYQRILSIPRVNLSDVPLLIQINGKIKDSFSSEINYYFYPWLFSDAFPDIDKDDLETLCVVSQLYAESLIQLDKVMDGQLDKYSETMKAIILMSSQYKLSVVILKLNKLFAVNSPFWNKYNQLFNEYLYSTLEEKTNKGLESYSVQDMEKSAIGKVALSKIITAAMGELTGQKDLLPMIEQSQSLFSIGYQLYDDVKDWRSDYLKCQYSYLLKRAFNEFGLTEFIADKKLPSIENFARCLYLSDIIPDTLELAENYLERAKEIVGAINCPKWISFVQMQQLNIINLKSDLLEIRDRSIERARLRNISKMIHNTNNSISLDIESCNKAIIQGITFLKGQQLKRYLEARHLEMLSKESRNVVDKSTCCWGTVFQRAVVLHSLFLARQDNFRLDENVFASDLQALIDSRLQNRKGGWSYFPDICELPPDCDDLAEVIQILIATSHPETPYLCDESIKLALLDQKSDGSIGTWIADPSDISSVKAKDNMHHVWGPCRDIEVMANFLYALWKYDSRRFADNIKAGTSYIASKQNQNGSWESTWYEGPYYGTWMCCRLLNAVGGYTEILNKAKHFILKKKKEYGGWDSNQEAILNTSYCLIALINELGEKQKDVIEPAARQIINTQREDGSWSSSIFLKMIPVNKVLKSMPGFQHQFYESDTMSTAFAIRSLLALRKILL